MGVPSAPRIARFEGLFLCGASPVGHAVCAYIRPISAVFIAPAYAVEVRHKEDHAQQQATEVHLKDAQTLARDVLRALPEVVAVLPPDEVHAVLSELPILR